MVWEISTYSNHCCFYSVIDTLFVNTSKELECFIMGIYMHFHLLVGISFDKESLAEYSSTIRGEHRLVVLAEAMMNSFGPC